MKYSILSIFLIPFLFGITNAYGADWYDSDWQKTRAIETDSSDFDSDLTDYPLYLNITSIDVGTDTQADCDDVILVNYYNNTILPFELENCDSTNDIIEMWVKLPTAYSANATRINLYYDYSSATDQQDPHNTWRSEYVLVSHLNGTFADSTSYANDGTNDGSSANSNEYIGDSRSFDGTNDVVKMASGFDDTDSEDILSFSVWFNRNSGGNANMFALGIAEGSGNLVQEISINTNGEYQFQTKTASGFITWEESGSNYEDSQWHLANVVYDRSTSTTNPSMYIDGSLITETETQNNGGDPKTNDDAYFIGSRSVTTVWNWGGSLDEIRVYTGTLSSNWVSSDYECQRKDGSCITIGDEQTEPSGAETRTVTDEIALEDDGASYTYDSIVNPSDEIALEDGGATRTTVGADTRTVTDEIALEDGGVTAVSDTVFVSDEIVLEDSASGSTPIITYNAIVLSVNTSPFSFEVHTNATRPTCNAGNEGSVIYNSDGTNLNICNGVSWILPDGTNYD